MGTLEALEMLLAYPERDLKDALGNIVEIVIAERLVPTERLGPLLDALADFRDRELEALQADHARSFGILRRGSASSLVGDDADARDEPLEPCRTADKGVPAGSVPVLAAFAEGLKRRRSPYGAVLDTLMAAEARAAEAAVFYGGHDCRSVPVESGWIAAAA